MHTPVLVMYKRHAYRFHEGATRHQNEWLWSNACAPHQQMSFVHSLTLLQTLSFSFLHNLKKNIHKNGHRNIWINWNTFNTIQHTVEYSLFVGSNVHGFSKPCWFNRNYRNFVGNLFVALQCKTNLLFTWLYICGETQEIHEH